MSPQRPRPPQPGRAAPRRPATPRPARPAAATPERASTTDEVFSGSQDATAPVPAPHARTAGTAPTTRVKAPGTAATPRTGTAATPRTSTAATPRTGTAATPRTGSGTGRGGTSGTARPAAGRGAAGVTSAGAAAPATPRRSAPGRRAGSTVGTVTPTADRAPRTPSGGVLAQGSAARFAERARAHRRLTQRRMAIIAAAVLAAGALVWLFFFSPVLALHAEQVRVTGADEVVAVDQVQAVIDAQDAVPLLRLDTSALRSQLLTVPGVRDATVTREWPHGLSVSLVAREPVAAVPESSEVAQSAEGTPTGAGFALVDEEGVQVGRADVAPEGLPVVDVPVGQERVLTAVLGVLDQLPADLLSQVGAVSATTQDSVNFTLRDGAAVEWGSSQDSALKAAVLSALRAAPETAAATRYDVSAPTMPVVG